MFNVDSPTAAVASSSMTIWVYQRHHICTYILDKSPGEADKRSLSNTCHQPSLDLTYLGFPPHLLSPYPARTSWRLPLRR